MSLVTAYREMMRHAHLQDTMMEKLDVREALTKKPSSPAVMRRAVNRCLSCDSSDECEQWLGKNETADHAPSFCRNASLFERVLHDIEVEGAAAT